MESATYKHRSSERGTHFAHQCPDGGQNLPEQARKATAENPAISGTFLF